jgi:hypothetical protein
MRLENTARRASERGRRLDANKRVCHDEANVMKYVDVLMKDDVIVIERMYFESVCRDREPGRSKRVQLLI